MKKTLLLLLILSLSALAKIPTQLPSFDNINSVLFREIKSHMFQVLSSSILNDFDNNCRVYKYKSINSSNPSKSLIFCLENLEVDNILTQELRVQVDHQFAGSFKLIHEGKSISPVSFDAFINFQIPAPKKGSKLSFYFDHLTFGMVIDRREALESLDTFFQVDDFRVNITEDGEENKRYRNYLLSCTECSGVTWLKVQENNQNIRYFTGHNPSEVTPAHFNKLINFFIIRPFSRFGIQLKDTLVLELNWPSP
jgi:hypothetical protein